MGKSGYHKPGLRAWGCTRLGACLFPAFPSPPTAACPRLARSTGPSEAQPSSAHTMSTPRGPGEPTVAAGGGGARPYHAVLSRRGHPVPGPREDTHGVAQPTPKAPEPWTPRTRVGGPRGGGKGRGHVSERDDAHGGHHGAALVHALGPRGRSRGSWGPGRGRDVPPHGEQHLRRAWSCGCEGGRRLQQACRVVASSPRLESLRPRGQCPVARS